MILSVILLSLSLLNHGPQEIPPNGIVIPRVLKSVRAQYTKAARDARIEGMVVVEVLIDIDGVPTNPRVVESLDSKYGLDDEAVRASRQWRFSPATKHGQPIEYTIRLEHSFQLDR